ncbi:MAG: hypothetical protein HYV09_02195 [Deltaproteobacteria bacterium]|nr:hypothetical protein [Deltaproteobacteria bacterium]
MRGRLVKTLFPMLMAAVLGGGCGGDDDAPPGDAGADVGEQGETLAPDTEPADGADAPADVEADRGTNATDDAADDGAAGDGDAEADADGAAETAIDARDDVAPDTSVDAGSDVAVDGGVADATSDGDATTAAETGADADGARDARVDGDVGVDASSDGADGGDGGPKKCTSDADCDNMIFCDGKETCDPDTGDPVTGCLVGAPPSCDDGVACTLDSCNEALKSCSHAPQHAACLDPVFCNGEEKCEPATGDPVTGCVAGTALSCDDDIPCTTDSCNESSKGCTHEPAHAACDNAFFCDGAERCDPTLGCVSGTPPSCDDARSCTDDACINAIGACAHTPNHSSCGEGFFCSPTGPTPTGCVAGTPSAAPSATPASTCEHCDEATKTCRMP